MRDLWAVIFKQYSTGTVPNLFVWRRFTTFAQTPHPLSSHLIASSGLRALRALQERD